MKITIHPSQLAGTVTANASKSSMQRACAAALLKNGKTILHNPGNSNDDKAAVSIIEALGAKAERSGAELLIESRGISPVASSIHCGESGLSIRMFTPLVALSEKEITINGSGSLVTRPMDFFDEILPQLGVSIKSNGGKLPMIIQGPLQPADIEVDGSLSSQFLTGLLMAYSAAGARDVSIRVNNLKSRPYIDLTLEVMKQFGMSVPDNRNYEAFVFSGNTEQRAPETVNYFVEGDWSGGAFLLVAGAIAGPIMVRGLDRMSTQADKAVYEAMLAANVNIVTESSGMKIFPSALQAFDFDATDCPDLFPPLVALASYCEGTSTISGVGRLTHKESNRAVTLQEEFGKMGVKIEFDDKEMRIYGGGKLKGTAVHSRHDHRIAMACAIAALKAEGETEIEEAQAVNKSYPAFYEHLSSLGATISGGFVYSVHE